jgi:ABC-type transport system involved in multi-copper enzyme maturation permease subunit
MAMIKNIFYKEILLNLISFRFHILLVVSVLIFTVSGLLYINISDTRQDDFIAQYRMQTDGLHEGSAHLNNLAMLRQHLIRMPKPGEIISLAGEQALPDLISFDAFFLGGSDSNKEIFSDIDRYNYMLNNFIPLDWVFIAGILLSFFILVLTFDAFPGEKQSGTLKLQCAYPVSRLSLFFAKYLAFLVLITLTFLLGTVICLITISLASSFQIVLPSIGQIISVILISLVYFSVFILLGLWFSSITENPAASLAYSLFTWMMLVIFIPSGMAMLGEKLRPIPSAFEHTERVNATVKEINDNAPSEAKTYFPPRYYGGQAYPHMDIRKKMIDEIDAVSNEYKVIRFNDQLRQVNMAVSLGKISPYVLFRNISECIAQNGLQDFENDFVMVVNHRRIFHEFIESKDSEDPGSLHFMSSLHPETYSSAPVNFEEIPILTETRQKPLAVLEDAAMDIGLLILFNLVVLTFGWIGFLRYDVR